MNLSDKINILVKLALEYNASVISYASLIHNQQPLSGKNIRRAIQDFKRMDKEYRDKTSTIIRELEAEVS